MIQTTATNHTPAAQHQMNLLVDRVAKMRAYEVPSDQIMRACGLRTIEEVDAIIAKPECQAVIQRVAVESFEKKQTLNDAWDAAEASSLNIIHQALTQNPDPDFALRTAMYANKANRRGVHANRPIQGNVVGRAVITLNNTFVSKLQQNWIVTERESIEATKKAQDFLSPNDIEDILGANGKNGNGANGSHGSDGEIEALEHDDSVGTAPFTLADAFAQAVV